MTTLTDRLRKLQDEVARLVREHRALRAKAAELGSQVHDHQRMVDTLKARVGELERENEVLRKGRVAEGAPAAPGTKERIDELVQEIDQCLTLLSERP